MAGSTRTWLLIGVAAVAAGFGCGCGADDEPAERAPDVIAAQNPAAPSADGAPSAKAATRGSESRRDRKLAPGEMWVLPRLQGISVRANRATRESLLRELSRRALFDLEIGSLPPRELTLELVDQPLPLVLQQVLDGAPYSVDYETSPAGNHRLVWLSAGHFPEDGSAQPASGTPRSAGEGDAADRREKGTGPQGRRRQYLRGLAERLRESGGFEARIAERERRAEREGEALAELSEGDESARLGAVPDIDADGPGVSALSRAAVRDPSELVRLEAVRSLGDADSYEATRGLIGALSDTSPAVVAEALRQLGYTYDPSVVQHFPAGLGAHDDPKIREVHGEVVKDLAD